MTPGLGFLGDPPNAGHMGDPLLRDFVLRSRRLMLSTGCCGVSAGPYESGQPRAIPVLGKPSNPRWGLVQSHDGSATCSLTLALAACSHLSSVGFGGSVVFLLLHGDRWSDGSVRRMHFTDSHSGGELRPASASQLRVLTGSPSSPIATLWLTFRRNGSHFILFAQPSIPSNPGDCAFDHPPARQ